VIERNEEREREGQKLRQVGKKKKRQKEYKERINLFVETIP
jgi:hypothetical protein